MLLGTNEEFKERRVSDRWINVNNWKGREELLDEAAVDREDKLFTYF